MLLLSLWPLAGPRVVGAQEGTPAGGKEKPVVVWLDRAQMPQGEEYVSGLLPRELVRQAVLLAVRDELHRLTRDPVIGETRPPADQTQLSSLRLKLNPERQQFEIVLLAAKPGDSDNDDSGDGSGQQVWRHVCELPEDPFESLVSLIDQLEQVSRAELPEALREHWQLAADNEAASEVASGGGDSWEKIDALLAEPDAFSHFQAIRMLHARRQGEAESADSLSRLARGYANLSILTRHHWQADSTAYGARALLYAQRLKQLPTAGPLQAWQAAYVPAVLGLHWHVLESLPALEPTWTAELAQQDPWVELVVPLAKCDFGRLKELAAADAPTARLAKLWWFTWSCYHITTGEFSKRWRETAQVCPGAAEVYVRGYFQGIYEDQPAASRALFRAIPEYFLTWVRGDIGLPENMRALRQARQGLTVLGGLDREGERGFGGPFAEAGTEAVDLATLGATDWHEFTWGVAAELVREELFQAAVIELRDRSAGETSELRETGESMAKVVGPHRYANVLRFLGIYPRQSSDEAEQLVREIELGDVTVTMAQFCRWTRNMRSERDDGMGIGTSTWSRLPRDYSAAFLMEQLSLPNMFDEETTVELAQLVERASPEHPMPMRFLMRMGGEINDARVNLWLPRVKPDDGRGLYELARLFREMDRPGKSVEYYTKALELNYDPELQAERAEVYWTMRRYVEWERDLSGSLPHFKDRQLSAHYHWLFASQLMEIGKWDEAVEPAEKAAVSEDGSALEALGTAYELTGRLKESEKVFEKMSRTNDDQARVAWYLWCHRNGDRENLKAARRVLAEFTRSPIGQQPIRADVMGTIALLEKNQAKALEFWMEGHQTDFRTDGWNSMMAAWLAHEMGQTAQRDRILEEFRPKMELWRNQYRFSFDEPIDTFTYTIAECLQDKPTPERLEMIEFYFPGLWFERQQAYGFLVGKIFEMAGDQQKAEYYWKAGLHGRYAAWPGASLAGAELVKKFGPRATWDTAANRQRKQP
ncbi:MAG: tetratricopeptide repeat protein [Pirellulales bacterium]